MGHFVFIPSWFQGYDFILDFIVLFILVVIAYNFKKVNLYTSSRISKMFEISFFLLIISFFIKDVINLFLYLSNESLIFLSSNTFLYNLINSMIFYEIGIFLYRSTYLVAFFLIYKQLLKENCKWDFFGIFTMIVLSYFSLISYWMYYFVLSFLLVSITVFYYTRILSHDISNESKRYVFLFFTMIMLSKIMVLIFIQNGVLIGMLLELLGYLFLILSFNS